MTEQTIQLNLSGATAAHQLGVILGRSLPAGTVILLEGNLGSGKTTLVQGIGHGLEISELIVSPTFTLINEYLDGRVPLYHLDLYRLQASEVDGLHPEAYWEGLDFPLGIVAIEWAERLQRRPLSYLHIHLTIAAEDHRRASLTPASDLQIPFTQILHQFSSRRDASIQKLDLLG